MTTKIPFENDNLNKVFSALNKCLFQKRLKSIKFLANPSEKHVLHLRLPNVVEIGGGFAEASIIDILDTLVHIMVHLENHRLKIEDFTDNQYHRREFCEKALEVGLTVVWHKTRGWSLTYSDLPETLQSESKVRHPSIDAKQKLKDTYDSIAQFYSIINDFRGRIRRDIKHKPTKLFQLKYVCSCNPPVIVRSGRRPDGPKPLDASCNICGAKFVIEDQRVD